VKIFDFVAQDEQTLLLSNVQLVFNFIQQMFYCDELAQEQKPPVDTTDFKRNFSSKLEKNLGALFSAELNEEKRKRTSD